MKGEEVHVASELPFLPFLEIERDVTVCQDYKAGVALAATSAGESCLVKTFKTYHITILCYGSL